MGGAVRCGRRRDTKVCHAARRRRMTEHKTHTRSRCRVNGGVVGEEGLVGRGELGGDIRLHGRGCAPRASMGYEGKAVA